MNNLNLEENCPHCKQNSHALHWLLEETENFRVVCDSYSITEGHILVIPKAHITCSGAYSEKLFQEFEQLYAKVKTFLKTNYSSAAVFEHGITGQTVFHAHTHFMPFTLTKEKVVPEGENYLTAIPNLKSLRQIYQDKQKYLFMEIDGELFTVSTELGQPRFFRDRFANALDKPEYGNWKQVSKNPEITKKFKEANKACKNKWSSYFL